MIDEPEIPQRVYRPYVGTSLTYGKPFRVTTWMQEGTVTGIYDGDNRVIRTGDNLTVDKGDWLDCPIAAKREMGLMLCAYIDGIREQVDEVLAEVHEAETKAKTETEQKGVAA